MSEIASLNRHHSAELGGAPVLDVEVVRSLQELGGEDEPGLLLELVQLYLEDAEERVDCIRSSREIRDVEAVARMAHALKSASANLGAKGFSRSCSELELAARGGDWDQVGPLVDKALGMYVELRAVLESLRQDLL